MLAQVFIDGLRKFENTMNNKEIILSLFCDCPDWKSKMLIKYKLFSLLNQTILEKGEMGKFERLESNQLQKDQKKALS